MILIFDENFHSVLDFIITNAVLKGPNNLRLSNQGEYVTWLKYKERAEQEMCWANWHIKSKVETEQPYQYDGRPQCMTFHPLDSSVLFSHDKSMFLLNPIANERIKEITLPQNVIDQAPSYWRITRVELNSLGKVSILFDNFILIWNTVSNKLSYIELDNVKDICWLQNRQLLVYLDDKILSYEIENESNELQIVGQITLPDLDTELSLPFVAYTPVLTTHNNTGVVSYNSKLTYAIEFDVENINQSRILSVTPVIQDVILGDYPVSSSVIMEST